MSIPKLDAAPLLRAIPFPPAARGEREWTQWYVARKQGEVTLPTALMLCEKADVPLGDVYPDMKESTYVDGEIVRDCQVCETTFVARKKLQKGPIPKTCTSCKSGTPEHVKVCDTCTRVFKTSRANAKYCSEYCRNQVHSEKRRERVRDQKKQNRSTIVTKQCTNCNQDYETNKASNSRYCEICRKIRSYSGSQYLSPYPMCAACGGSKADGRATCGAESCKSKHKTAKGTSKSYAIMPEELLVMRACPRCDACSQPFEQGSYGNIDHCHATGKVRGVLCSPCNTALGFAKEDANRLRSLAEFIEKHT